CMTSATITSKGQLTLPKAMREHLKLREGDRVEFVTVGRDVRLVPRNRPVDTLYGRLSAYAKPDTTLQDYDAAIGAGISAHLDSDDLEEEPRGT
ncbi:MAG TPA: AbrB/MazE/SpoVT family DNA-binding domain-containing protein, partial [Aurantimonas sp.]